MRLDWLEPTLSEGGTTVGRAWAVTIELVELGTMMIGSRVSLPAAPVCFEPPLESVVTALNSVLEALVHGTSRPRGASGAWAQTGAAQRAARWRVSTTSSWV